MDILTQLGAWWQRVTGGKYSQGKRALDDPAYQGWLMSQTAASGVDVNPDTALRMMAVFACIRVLSEGVAQLPLILYRRLPGGGKERAFDLPLYTILHDLPNYEMVAFTFRETMMAHLCSWGNAYAEIELDKAGRVRGLWPLRPDLMTVTRDKETKRLAYVYDRRPMPIERVFHIPGMGYDGRMGYSPIEMARQAIGLGMAAEEFSARFFANDARPGIVLEHPGHLGEVAYKNLQGSWKDEHGGITNASKPAILEEGMKVHEIGLPGQDVEFLNTRKFQRSEIAALYRVPPHMIADLERATFSNIEQQSLEFVIYTLTPWLVRFEQAITWKLIPEKARGEIFAEHLVDGLLRGDTQSRYTAYSVGRQNGWLSANDVRERENMNPIEGGDVYLIPLNMVPANEAGQSAPGAAAPSAAREISNFKFQISNADEERGYKSARARQRLGHAYRRMFVDVFARVVRREAADVRKAAARYLKGDGREATGEETRDVGNFNLWLASFYSEHKGFVERNVAPLYASYGDAVAQMARDEVSADGDMAPELGRFTGAYTRDLAERHSNIGESALRDAVQGAVESGGDPAQAVEETLTKWETPATSRADDTAMWESVRFGNAIAATVFAIAGWQFLRWHSFGESCPYCKKLNGTKVGIKETFLQPGTAFEADGAEKPLTVGNKVHHPPAHGGCDCGISAA